MVSAAKARASRSPSRSFAARCRCTAPSAIPRSTTSASTTSVRSRWPRATAASSAIPALLGLTLEAAASGRRSDRECRPSSLPARSTGAGSPPHVQPAGQGQQLQWGHARGAARRCRRGSGPTPRCARSCCAATASTSAPARRSAASRRHGEPRATIPAVCLELDRSQADHRAGARGLHRRRGRDHLMLRRRDRRARCLLLAAGGAARLRAGAAHSVLSASDRRRAACAAISFRASVHGRGGAAIGLVHQLCARRAAMRRWPPDRRIAAGRPERGRACQAAAPPDCADADLARSC